MRLNFCRRCYSIGKACYDNIVLPAGDLENNFTNFENQTDEADKAIFEKRSNSIDAILLKECLERESTEKVF